MDNSSKLLQQRTTFVLERMDTVFLILCCQFFHWFKRTFVGNIQLNESLEDKDPAGSAMT